MGSSLTLIKAMFIPGNKAIVTTDVNYNVSLEGKFYRAVIFFGTFIL